MRDDLWWTKSWSPITGCSPISEACEHCWARRMAQRLKGRFGYPKDDPFKVMFHSDRLDQPLKWKKPRHIFVVSMGDLFHPGVLWSDNQEIWESMAKCPQHTFLILTKRVERMKIFLTEDLNYKLSLPLPNVWLGCTAENQPRADERVGVLLQIPAAKHFVSIEPMLGPVDISYWLNGAPEQNLYGEWIQTYPPLAWVIAGCESGPNRRQAKIQWFRDLKNQCGDANIPFFLKQTNGYINGKSVVVKMPILDGKQWNEVPS